MMHTHTHCPTVPFGILTICLPCTFQTLKYFSKCMSVFVLSLANLLCETGSCGGRLALSDEKVAEPSSLSFFHPRMHPSISFFTSQQPLHTSPQTLLFTDPPTTTLHHLIFALPPSPTAFILTV